MDYSTKLKNPKWQKKRLEILNRDEFACQSCYDDKSTLHVHHLKYIPGKEPWDIDNDLLVTLCESCHELETKMDKERSYDCLIDVLKSKRFLMLQIESLSEIFSKINRDWSAFDPNFDILEMVLTDKTLWRQMHETYFERLRLKHAKTNPDNDGETK